MAESTQSSRLAPVESKKETNSLRRVVGLFVSLALIVIILGLFPRLFRLGSAPLAESMPADTVLYVELDALNLLNANSQRIAEAFQPLFAEADLNIETDNPLTALEELDSALFDELGLTFSDDIFPWLGTNMALGMNAFDAEVFSQNRVPNVIFAAAVRDRNEADRFVQSLVTAVEKQPDLQFARMDHEGVLFYVVDSPREEDRIAMARSEDAFLLTSNEESMRQAIEAQNGPNLAQNEQYQNTINQLPPERIISAYLSGDLYQSLFASLENDPGFSELDVNALNQFIFESVGMAMSTTPQGIQMDFKVLFNEFTPEQQALFDAQTPELSVPQLLPDSTYLLVTSQRLDLNWEVLQSSFGVLGLPAADIEESMALFDSQFGFNPLSDWLPLMDGEYGLALIESNEGLIAQQTAVDVGALLFFETSKPSDMDQIVQIINQNVLLGLGLFPQQVNLDQANLYLLQDPFLGGEIAAYGVSDHYLLIGTSSNDLRSLFTNPTPLAEAEKYQSTWAAFPEDTIPVMYMDIEEMMATFSTAVPGFGFTPGLNPITTAAMGIKYEGLSSTSTIILFVP